MLASIYIASLYVGLHFDLLSVNLFHRIHLKLEKMAVEAYGISPRANDYF